MFVAFKSREFTDGENQFSTEVLWVRLFARHIITGFKQKQKPTIMFFRTLARFTPTVRFTAHSARQCSSIAHRHTGPAMGRLFETRPVVGKVTTALQTQQARGMKVRSSVKKLCDGCMVRFSGIEEGWRDKRDEG
jgi:hypothetical protein